MDKKLTKLIGLKKTEFEAYVECGEIILRQATLIPIQKLGDEMALTSVILSGIRLIKEFRKHILSAVKMQTGGTIFVYTEVAFKEFPESRIDGLLLVVKGGTIRDAALFEMKNGTAKLEQEQIDRYAALSKALSIPNLITVSNEYVTDPTQSPLTIRSTKNFTPYHFSWSYLLTIAHILLFDNDTNIADDDQIEIMREIVLYLENKKSGVCGFNEMKPGWKHVVEKINSGTSLKQSDPDVEQAVISWHQEEKDLALLLSRKLGLFVGSGENKYKGKLKNRIDDDKKKLLSTKHLYSVLRVKGAVSNIDINAMFEKRIIEACVTLTAPKDKKLKGQLGWIKRQFDTCQKRGLESFDKVAGELKLDIVYRNKRQIDRIALQDIDAIYSQIKDLEIKEFRIIRIKDFGKNFAAVSKFVVTLDSMIVEYYKNVVQHLVKWEPSAPRIVEEVTKVSNMESENASAEEDTQIAIETGATTTESELVVKNFGDPEYTTLDQT